MAKRFSATDKWRKQFIKGLPTVHKLLWLYMLDECDHAGIWDVELDVASLRIGEDVNNISAGDFDGKIIEIDSGKKWFIKSFISFQYGTLNDKVNAQKSALDRLKQFLTIKDIQPFINCSSTVKDKDKDKDKDKAVARKRNPVRLNPPSFEEVEKHCASRGMLGKAQQVYDYYASGDWTDKGGNEIYNWKQKMNGSWLKKEKPEQEQTFIDQMQPHTEEEVRRKHATARDPETNSVAEMLDEVL